MASINEEKDLDINETLEKVENYWENNKKSISIIIGAIVLVVGGYFIYTNFIVAPQEKEAEKEMFMAEQYFGQDSMKLALNGDGNKMGFLQIIENYGSSNSANLAHYYAGICYLKTGDFQNAIEQLDKYDAEDDVTGAIAFGGMGDASLELGKKDDALKYYKKAIDWDKNQFTAPLYMMKAATVYELNSDFKSAADLYQKIKKDFPNSTEARDVDRYIARADAMASK